MKSQFEMLRPGGSVSALVFAKPQECRFFSNPVAVTRKHAGSPSPTPGLPGPLRLGAAGIIETLFEDAGSIVVRT